MTARRTIPWKQITVEATAIVVSILLAFAIDAWWSEKKERNVEREALQLLRSDFVSSREELARVLQRLANARVNFARFQSAAHSELVAMNADTIRPIIGGLVITNTFDPVTATLDALVNDGRLGLISDSQLLGQLSNWQTALDNLEDLSFELRTSSLRVRRASELHGGPFIRWRRSLDDIEILRRPSGETLVDLRQDEVYMGKARSHQYALSAYLLALRRLAEDLDSTVALLDQMTAQQ